MDDSIARSRRRRAAGSLGVSQAEAVAPGSFVSDLAFDASFQGLQGEGERGAGGGLWGSGASGGGKEQESFDVAVDDAPRAAAGQFMASFSGGSSFGGNSSSLFSGMQLFGSQSPVVMQQQQQQQQQQMASVQQQQQRQQMQNFSSSLGWQNMTGLVGGQQSLGQSQSQALMHGLGFGSEQGIAPSNSLGHLIPAEENWIGRDGDAIPASEMSLGGDSSDSENSSKGEAGRLRRRKEKLAKGGSPGDKLWRKLRGSEKGGEKSEAFRESGEPSRTPRTGPKARKSKHKHTKPRGVASEGLLEDSVNEEFLASSSDSGSSSDYSDRDKKEGWNKKRKRAGQDADGNVTWTDESVKFLFETYDAIHQRLWEESNGHVKYQKKWTPILKAMQDKFGKHFSKKQCQSKYWSVRRECADYRNMSAKAARSDPSWNPSIAGRELLKPKFYDVWFEVSGKKEAIVTNPNIAKTADVKDGGDLKTVGQNASWKVVGKDGQSTKHKVEDCGTALKEMQRLMQVQLQASEKREEAMKFRAELMMDLLTQHMEHVERRVSNLDEGRQPQLYLLERVNHKLEKVLEGFTALNENLSIVAFKFTQKQS
ncbi:hypothetical protein KC19_2G288500 [Ceratodon purpureus]|uniref:Myb-like domain-containing protein n=1 Tax=Ceratodon purpureus TaxID=3225 RepID=A0A8T0J2G7_CERPU|nr:hypothetical protein KC19_2G288500 [Ceratodon purpureus]